METPDPCARGDLGNCGLQMPLPGGTIPDLPAGLLPQADRDLICNWIVQGAQNDSAPTGASAATLSAECRAANSPYHAGTTPFPAQDFCTLFIATCSSYVVVSALGAQDTCETTYSNWTNAQMRCRTAHLCNATEDGVVSENPHCFHAQGWASATTQGGGPCL